jgi:hypothetical protein
MFEWIEYMELKDWENVYFFAMHFNGLLSLLSTILAVYIILKKSTVHIQTYKWYLLNIVLFSFYVDFYLSILYIPKITLIENAITPLGLLKIVGDHTLKRIEFVSILINFNTKI